MQKQNEKWTAKAASEIKNYYSKGELLRQVVLIQLEESQTRVEQQNSDLVNQLKFKMKMLPKSRHEMKRDEFERV